MDRSDLEPDGMRPRVGRMRRLLRADPRQRLKAKGAEKYQVLVLFSLEAWRDKFPARRRTVAA